MACCIITAYVMSKFIRTCDLFNIQVIKAQYNAFDDGPERNADEEDRRSQAVAKFTVSDMECSACTSTISSALKDLPGVNGVTTSLALATVSVVYDPEQLNETDLLLAIEKQGYSGQPVSYDADAALARIERTTQLQRLSSAFSSSATLASASSLMAYLQPYVADTKLAKLWAVSLLLLCMWIQLVNAKWIHESAWSKGKWKSPTMDTLISISLILGLYLQSMRTMADKEYLSAAKLSSGSFLVVIISGGRYLDNLLRKQLNDSLSNLYSLQSETTMVDVNEGASSRVSPTKKRTPAVLLEPGDVIAIYSGDTIPCDCYVSTGSSIINQAAMTGESLPVSKSVGDFLMSGTHNLTSDLEAIVCKTQAESTLAKLVSSAAQATETSEVDEDMLSTSFVQIVLILGVCAGLYEYNFRAALPLAIRVTFALERVMAVLSSACPCALGLASPSAIMSGLAAAWERGIVIRNGAITFQNLANLSHIVLDKTGTLTTGRLSVAGSSRCVSPITSILICAAEREESSTHPVARAVFQWAFRQLSSSDRLKQASIAPSDIRRVPGRGVCCTIKSSGETDSSLVHIGSSAFFESEGINVACGGHSHPAGGIIVHVAVDRALVTSIVLTDTIRSEATRVLSQLRKSVSLTMLTGDTAAEAQRVAKTLSLNVLSTSSLPHEKADFIRSLRDQSGTEASSTGATIAMVGDGLNDAAAFRASDVGILLSSGPSALLGAEASLADVIISSPDLLRLPESIHIAKATMRQIAWNRCWALGYNVIAVGVAVGFFEKWGIRLDASYASILMAFSSISILAWSFWFRRSLRGTLIEATK